MPLNHFCFLPQIPQSGMSLKIPLKSYHHHWGPLKTYWGVPHVGVTSETWKMHLAFWSFWKPPPLLTLSFLQSFLLCCSLLSSSLFSMVHGHIRFCQSHLWAVRIWMWMHPRGSVSVCVCGCACHDVEGEGYIRPADPSHSSCQT